ncbi:twin-arginine translocation signal domain-containing protein [Halalkalicoccus paucihalophilus]|uniref:twin-arginine translocation signal domain-containing protein n=1 Tax=Halalkalicoccus paucihalophilus TaxID=1008153 RepID=UPI0012EDA2D0
MTEQLHTTNESPSGLSRRTFMKAVGAAGAVAATGTTRSPSVRRREDVHLGRR